MTAQRRYDPMTLKLKTTTKNGDINNNSNNHNRTIKKTHQRHNYSNMKYFFRADALPNFNFWFFGNPTGKFLW